MLHLLLLAVYALIVIHYLPQLFLNKSTKPSTAKSDTTAVEDTQQETTAVVEEQPAKEEEKCITETTPPSITATISTKQHNINDNKDQSVQQVKETRRAIIPAMPPSKSKLIELLKKPLPDNDVYFLNQLAVLTLNSLQLPPDTQLIEPMTNALRVSSQQPTFICDFISLLIGSPISKPQSFSKKEQFNYNKLTFNSKPPTPSATPTTQKTEQERMAVSTLESINRMHAELWITYPSSKSNTLSPLISPTSSTDTAKRSSFTSSSDSNSDDTRWFSSSHHASSTSNTTVTTTLNNKFNFSALMTIDDLHKQRLNPFDASLDDVMKFQLDFIHIKSKIESLVLLATNEHFCSPWGKQIQQAVELLVKNANGLSTGLEEFKCGYVFVQLCKMVTWSTRETNARFGKLANTVMIEKQDLNELENWVNKSAHLTGCISKAFKSSLIANKEYQEELKSIYKVKLDVLTGVCDQALDHLKQIQSVWRRANDIKTSISEGVDTLNEVGLSDAQLSKTYAKSLATVRETREKLFGVVSQDLQILVNQVISTTSKTGAYNFTSYKKIKSNLVNSVFYQLQHFKNDLLKSTLILEKYGNKQKLKLDIENSKLWLQAYKTNLVGFALSVVCQWNPITNPLVASNAFADLKAQYDKFILNQYDMICEYFPRYSGSVIARCYTKRNITFNAYKTHGLNYQQLGDDVHLIQEYQWFQIFQGECDVVSDILKFISRIQQQQLNILTFIDHTEQFKAKLQSGGVGVKQEAAARIYKDEFHAIQWPTALEYGSILGNQFYFYSQALYLQVSKIKTEFISVCQDAFFSSRKV